MTFHDMIVADASSNFAAFGAAGFLVLAVLGALFFFFPLIVMFQLSGMNSRLDKARKADEKVAKEAALNAWNFNGSAESDREDILRELKAQNKLTRQLLKAYGHEPEA